MASGPGGHGGDEQLSTDQLVASQVAYYRAHARRYDDWWFRRGHHDLGPLYRDSWNAQVETLRAALVDFAPLGDVVEFAGGTGNWTLELAALAASVTVVDASPEAVAIAQKKVSGRVTWQIADIFEYRPARGYDTAFFGFWLSHVPPARFEGFWELVGECLKPGGRVFFIDNAHPAQAEAVAPEFYRAGGWSSEETRIGGIDSVTDVTTGVARRVAADGRSYQLVKIWREPAELRSRLADLGWNMQVLTTDWAFIYGFGTKAKAHPAH